MLFVDDLILLSNHPASISHMLKDLQPALKEIGLDLSEEKSAYITTSPALAARLPGTNSNRDGLKILGRTYKFEENTTAEIAERIGNSWGKFHAIKRILSAPTPLKHRLAIFKACVGQFLLWGSETWHLTKRNLQRIRGMELKMHRSMIPPPEGHDSKNDPQFFENWKTHIRKKLRENNYFGLDRQWIKKYHSWAGHVSRLSEERWAKKLLLHKTSNGGAANKIRSMDIDTQKPAEMSLDGRGAWLDTTMHMENWHSKARDREKWKESFAGFEKAVPTWTPPTKTRLGVGRRIRRGKRRRV